MKRIKKKKRPAKIFNAACFPCHVVLQEFWSRVTEGTLADRLLLLREFAERRAQTTAPYRSRRQGELGREVAGRGDRCFGCQKNRATLRHHVIQVQHGGSNRKQNLVYLCEPCHAEVHPWLMKAPTLPAELYEPIWTRRV